MFEAAEVKRCTLALKRRVLSASLQHKREKFCVVASRLKQRGEKDGQRQLPLVLSLCTPWEVSSGH